MKRSRPHADGWVVHAQAYDPQAPGEMERFWRTLREGCLDFLGELSTVHDVHVRLLAFLDAHYHHAPHAGLMGRTPAKLWATRTTRPLTEDELADALTTRERRQVHTDGALSVGGIDCEVEHGWLGGRLQLRVVDPKANARRRRIVQRAKCGLDAVDFHPNPTRVQRVLGKRGGAR